MHDADIACAERSYECRTRFGLHARQLHPHALGFGPAPRQGNQVAAGCATELEDARPTWIRRLEAMQFRHRCEEIRLGLGQRQAVVGEFVVAWQGIHGGDCPSKWEAVDCRADKSATTTPR